jgi:RHS repeat-associated protein
LAYKNDGTNLFAAYAWTYDARNRVTQFTSQDGTSDYTYDDTDQLTGADHSYQTDESYSYDANGNRTMTGYQTGTNNRLTNDGTYTYQYDDEGNRTKRTDNSTSEEVLYEWGFRNRLTKVTFKDEYGTTAKVVEHADTSVTRYLFTSRELDQDVDLQYNCARWYDAEVGRWISEDPLGFKAGDENLLRYVGNTPVVFVDSSGLEKTGPQGGQSGGGWWERIPLIGSLLKKLRKFDDAYKEAEQRGKELDDLSRNKDSKPLEDLQKPLGDSGVEVTQDMAKDGIKFYKKITKPYK